MKKTLDKIWYVVWKDNSILSWAVNAALAFILIKFLVYPGLGFVFDTDAPVVAVVSRSMEHNGMKYDSWWNSKRADYESFNITKQDFAEFSFKDGFNKGDIMLLRGKKPDDLKVGDIIVFIGGEKDPIIHRIVTKRHSGESYAFSTQGDNNANQLAYEKSISEERIVGAAFLRIPALGYIKVGFNNLISKILAGG